jgi:FKBP-type peptidyl-prolyl cis-trans isomerase FkpA
MQKKDTKPNRQTQIFAIVILLIFAGSLLAGFVAPLMNKDEKANEQADVQKQIEDLQKQQADAEANAPVPEVDPNLKQEGDITAMQIIDSTTGTGTEAKEGDTIKVKYKGALAKDGSVFDSNAEGVEFKLAAGSLIQGWVEGIPGMKVGGKRRLIIPSDKAYGPQGTQGIAPDSDLIFDIELINVK